MVKRVSIPPPGFEDLNAEEKVQYLQDLGPTWLPIPQRCRSRIGIAVSSMSGWRNITLRPTRENRGRRFATN
jgi:hypothetical protein